MIYRLQNEKRFVTLQSYVKKWSDFISPFLSISALCMPAGGTPWSKRRGQTHPTTMLTWCCCSPAGQVERAHLSHKLTCRNNQIHKLYTDQNKCCWQYTFIKPQLSWHNFEERRAFPTAAFQKSTVFLRYVQKPVILGFLGLGSQFQSWQGRQHSLSPHLQICYVSGSKPTQLSTDDFSIICM